MGVNIIDIGKTGGSDIDPLDVFKVGYVYQSFDPTSPAELFGGTWLKIDGYFLRAANNTGTGGADAVTLTVDQIPSHRHTWTSGWSRSANGDSYFTLGNAKANDLVFYGDYTGGSQSHSNMPKYQNVYTWRRTA